MPLASHIHTMEDRVASLENKMASLQGEIKKLNASVSSMNDLKTKLKQLLHQKTQLSPPYPSTPALPHHNNTHHTAPSSFTTSTTTPSLADLKESLKEWLTKNQSPSHQPISTVTQQLPITIPPLDTSPVTASLESFDQHNSPSVVLPSFLEIPCFHLLTPLPLKDDKHSFVLFPLAQNVDVENREASFFFIKQKGHWFFPRKLGLFARPDPQFNNPSPKNRPDPAPPNYPSCDYLPSSLDRCDSISPLPGQLPHTGHDPRPKTQDPSLYCARRNISFDTMSMRNFDTRVFWLVVVSIQEMTDFAAPHMSLSAILDKLGDSFPILKSDYYMVPCLTNFIRCDILDPGFSSVVPGFTIGLFGYGYIQFQIGRPELLVYDDGSQHLDSQGLNKTAAVTWMLQNGLPCNCPVPTLIAQIVCMISSNVALTTGTTILAAVNNSIDSSTQVVYSETLDAKFVQSNIFSYAIDVVSEPPYTENFGDTLNQTISQPGSSTFTNECGVVKSDLFTPMFLNIKVILLPSLMSNFQLVHITLTVGSLHLLHNLEVFPMLVYPKILEPIAINLSNHIAVKNRFSLLSNNLPDHVDKAVVSEGRTDDSKERGNAFVQAFSAHLAMLMEEPGAYRKLALANFLQFRIECLGKFHFLDCYRSIKQREKEKSLAVLLIFLVKLDSMGKDTTLTLIEGNLRRVAAAGNLLVDTLINTLDGSRENLYSVPLIVVENGCGNPCIALGHVNFELAATAIDADMIIFKTLGSALQTTFNTQFQPAVLSLGAICLPTFNTFEEIAEQYFIAYGVHRPTVYAILWNFSNTILESRHLQLHPQVPFIQLQLRNLSLEDKAVVEGGVMLGTKELGELFVKGELGDHYG